MPQRQDVLARLRSGTAWNLLSAVGSQGTTFVVSVIVANLLGPEGFGEYVVVQGTLATIAAVASCGTGYTATKYIAELRATDKERAGRVAALCLAMAATGGFLGAASLILGSEPLAVHMLNAPKLAVPLMIGASAVFFNVVNWFHLAALAGLERYEARAKADVACGAFYLVSCVVGARYAGLNGVMAGVVVSALLQWGVLHRLLRHQGADDGIIMRYRGLWRERSVILRFALPTAIPSLTTTPALWLANVFLVWRPNGYTEAALYGAANNLRILALFLPTTLNNVGMSLLNNQMGLGDDAKYRRVFWLNIGMVGVTVMGGALLIGGLGPTVLRIFGRDFAEAHTVLLVLLVSTVLEILWYALAQVVASHEQMWSLLLLAILPRDIAVVLLAYVLTPSLGARGLAIAYTASWALAFIVGVLLIRRIGLTTRLRWVG